MSGNQVQDTPAQAEQSQNRGSLRNAFFSVFSWSPAEAEKRLGIVPLENTRTKTTGSTENSPPGTAENKATVTIEDKQRETIQGTEENPSDSKKSRRRLSDYRDSEDVKAIIQERKDSKSKRLSAKNEQRNKNSLQDFREEEGIVDYVKTMRESKLAEKESKLAEKERRELERKNSKDLRKSRSSKNEFSKKITKIWSDYREDKEVSAVKSRDSKLTKRSSYHPAEATAIMPEKEQKRHDRKNSRSSRTSRKSAGFPHKGFKTLTRGSKDYQDDKDIIATKSSIMKGSKLKERSELAANQDQDITRNPEVD